MFLEFLFISSFSLAIVMVCYKLCPSAKPLKPGMARARLSSKAKHCILKAREKKAWKSVHSWALCISLVKNKPRSLHQLYYRASVTVASTTPKIGDGGTHIWIKLWSKWWICARPFPCSDWCFVIKKFYAIVKKSLLGHGEQQLLL